MKIIPYQTEYYNGYKEVVTLLWNDIDECEIKEEIKMHKTDKSRIFLAVESNKVIGFLNTSIRTDYVPGSNCNKTGYIEGIFVKEEYRKKDVAKSLLLTAFEYFKSIEITDVGSDAELDNVLSDTFHKAIGFKEIEVCRHYYLKL